MSRSVKRIYFEHHSPFFSGQPSTRGQSQGARLCDVDPRNLRAGIARGPGEYLASLATLTGISATIGPNFSQYEIVTTHIVDGQLSASQSSERVVDSAWAQGHGRQGTATPLGDRQLAFDSRLSRSDKQLPLAEITNLIRDEYAVDRYGRAA